MTGIQIRALEHQMALVLHALVAAHSMKPSVFNPEPLRKRLNELLDQLCPPRKKRAKAKRKEKTT